MHDRFLVSLLTFEICDSTYSVFLLWSGSTYHTFYKIRCLSVVLGICKSFAIILSHLSLLCLCGKWNRMYSIVTAYRIRISALNTLYYKYSYLHSHLLSVVMLLTRDIRFWPYCPSKSFITYYQQARHVVKLLVFHLGIMRCHCGLWSADTAETSWCPFGSHILWMQR